MDYGEIKHVVIKVDVVENYEIDPEDEGIEGVYAFSFFEGEAPELTDEQKADELDRFEEYGLDLFHERFGISELEPFDIVPTLVASEDDIPDEADRDLSTEVIMARSQARRAR